MKILGMAAKWAFILCLPVLLLTVSLGWAANSLLVYKNGFDEYGVSQSLADWGLNLTDSELEEVYARLLSYFNSNDEENISLTVVKNGKSFNLFTPEEIIHFRDVKGLIWLDYYILLGTLIYVSGYTAVSLLWQRRRYWRRLAWVVVGGSGITLAVMLALGLGTLFGFRQLFYQFHLLFFSNEFWSAEGYMLRLFPEPFFYDATLFCALVTSGMAVILGGVSGGYLLATRKDSLPNQLANRP